MRENERTFIVGNIGSALASAQTITVGGAEIVVLPKLVFDKLISATELLTQHNCPTQLAQPAINVHHIAQPNLNPEALLTSKEVADEWGITTAALEKWRFTGEGPPFIKLGKGNKARVRYRRKDIADFVAGCKKQNTA